MSVTSTLTRLSKLTPPDNVTIEHRDAKNIEFYESFLCEEANWNHYLKAVGIRGVKAIKPPDIASKFPVQETIRALLLCIPLKKGLKINFAQKGRPLRTDPCWFARQLKAEEEESCATVGAMNMAMNMDGLDLGEFLTNFKTNTAELTPNDRGQAILDSGYLRKLHNLHRGEEDAIADPDVIFERTGIPNHYVLMLPKNGVVLCFDGLRDRPAVVSRIIANEAWYEAPLINIRKFFDKKQLGDTLVIADI